MAKVPLRRLRRVSPTRVAPVRFRRGWRQFLEQQREPPQAGTPVAPEQDWTMPVAFADGERGYVEADDQTGAVQIRLSDGSVVTKTPPSGVNGFLVRFADGSTSPVSHVLKGVQFPL